jgi:hypothetical protein
MAQEEVQKSADVAAAPVVKEKPITDKEVTIPTPVAEKESSTRTSFFVDPINNDENRASSFGEHRA